MSDTERADERDTKATGENTPERRAPDTAEADVPGTGILGDETLVRDTDDDGAPGIYPAPPAHTGGAAHPGPNESKRTAEPKKR